MESITIRDIAKRAKVSPAAVSYVINNRPGVSEKTRELIENIIEETGYKPNISSRKLVLNKSFNIHIVIGSEYASFDNLFYNTAIHRMIEVCTEKGYNLVLSSTENYGASPLKRAVLQKDVDGVIFLQSAVSRAAQELQKLNIPYVVLDSHEQTAAHNSVYCDYEETAHSATKYLIAKGHKRIGFVGMENIKEFYNSACGGYLRAMREAGIAVDTEWMCGATNEEDSIKRCAQTVADGKKSLTAVLCATDTIAVMLMKQFEKTGVSVPGDISVCGMDDVLIARYSTPALTTIEIDKQKMGEESIRLLLDMIDEKVQANGERICVHSKNVIERDSVKSI